MDRQRHLRRRHDHLGARPRRRPGAGLHRREQDTRLQGREDRAQDGAARGPERADHARELPRAGSEPPAAGHVVPRHRARAAHDARVRRLGVRRLHDGRLRARAALCADPRAVRQADRVVPAHPGTPRQDPGQHHLVALHDGALLEAAGRGQARGRARVARQGLLHRAHARGRGLGARADGRERHPARLPGRPLRRRLRGALLVRGHARDADADRRQGHLRLQRVRVGGSHGTAERALREARWNRPRHGEPSEGAECPRSQDACGAARGVRGHSRRRRGPRRDPDRRRRQGLHRRRGHPGDRRRGRGRGSPDDAQRARRSRPDREPGQAGDRRDQRVRARRRLRDGDGVRDPDRRGERALRPARGEARRDPGLRRHAAHAASRGEGGGAPADPLRRADQRARGAAHRAGRRGRPQRAADLSCRGDPCPNHRQRAARSPLRDRRREQGSGREPGRRSRARVVAVRALRGDSRQAGRDGGLPREARPQVRSALRRSAMATKTNDSVFSGLKVVDLSSFVAGPAAAVILSDFCAVVVKVEPPSGQMWRHGNGIPPQPDAKEPYQWHLHSRNKRGMTLDLKAQSARPLLEKLVLWADVLIVNTPHPARKRLGLEYDDVVKWNPRLIYADLTGFGDHGLEADLPGFDITSYWARSGLLSLTRDAGASPTWPVGGSGDNATAVGLYAAIVTALYRRERTGKGSCVTTSLLAEGVWSASVAIQAALAGAKFYAPHDRKNPANAAFNVYRAADGTWFVLIVTADKLAAVAKAIGRPDLVTDSRFADPAKLIANRPQLTAILDDVFAAQPMAQWYAVFG